MNDAHGQWDTSPAMKVDIRKALDFASETLDFASEMISKSATNPEPLWIASTLSEMAIFWLLYKAKPQTDSDEAEAVAFVRSRCWREKARNCERTPEAFDALMAEEFAAYKKENVA